MNSINQTCFGKYRGTVTDVADPENRGRVKVNIPELFGQDDYWAQPCLPLAGSNVGMLFLPAVGSAVWIEFEAGDMKSPIWSGCLWPKDQPSPTFFNQQSGKVNIIKTDTFSINLNETEGKVEIYSNHNSQYGIELNSNSREITITNGQGEIKIDSVGSIQLNNPNLVVKK